MVARKPLVINAGEIEELSSSDTLDADVTDLDEISMTNAEVGAITIGQCVYVSSASNVKKAKADASATSIPIGFVNQASIAASASGSIIVGGVLTTSGLTAGSVYYLSESTAGAITATAPTGNSEYVVELGIALSTTELWIDIKKRIKLQ